MNLARISAQHTGGISYRNQSFIFHCKSCNQVLCEMYKKSTMIFCDAIDLNLRNIYQGRGDNIYYATYCIKSS